MGGLLLQDLSLSPELVTGVVVSSSSAVIAYYSKKVYEDWTDRAEKVDELYKAFFGMENVSTMEGAIEILEGHEDDIERHEEELDEIRDEVERNKRKREELDSRIDKIKSKMEERAG